jgi:hypothetical protein
MFGARRFLAVLTALGRTSLNTLATEDNDGYVSQLEVAFGPLGVTRTEPLGGPILSTTLTDGWHVSYLHHGIESTEKTGHTEMRESGERIEIQSGFGSIENMKQ